MKLKNVRQYDLIVLSHEPDATVWRVREINGFMALVHDAAVEDRHPNQTAYWHDVGSFKRPTKQQIEAFL
jgi:hypothetical protein